MTKRRKLKLWNRHEEQNSYKVSDKIREIKKNVFNEGSISINPFGAVVDLG